MRYAFAFLLLAHGFIHLMGFLKAYKFAEFKQLTREISKRNGLFWLFGALLFGITAGLVLLHSYFWWLPAGLAAVVSQALLFTSWKDAKFGSIANAITLFASIWGFACWNFYATYERDVNIQQEAVADIQPTILSEAELLYLPLPVQRYLRYTGAIGKPRVVDFMVAFNGNIRKNAQSAWMPFHSEQFNSLNTATRLFFMNATMKGLPVAGYHRFENGDAYMDIRLLSLFKVQYQHNPEMGIAETVTYFNDMCCMAPATLIDGRIKWLETQGNTVRASFTNNGITIEAWLYFNDEGALVNFVSDDRYATFEDGTMHKIRWSTPLSQYKEINGYRLPGYAEAIYHYPEGELCYGTFALENVTYNCIEK